MTADTLSARAIKRDLATSVMGRRVRCYRAVASTMDTARRLAERGAPEGTVVLAERQGSGRGRFARRWVSPAGMNLTFSIVLRPPAERLHLLNMAASVSLVEAIAESTGLTATVKWPNDVRVDGRKAAGILIEARTASAEGDEGHAVLGVGLNVNHDPSAELEPPAEATSLAAALSRPVDRIPVLRAFLRAFDALYVDQSSDEALYERWKASLDTLGQRVRVAWAGDGGAIVEGVAVDVERNGDLVLRRDDGSVVSLNAGEVTVVGTDSK